MDIGETGFTYAAAALQLDIKIFASRRGANAIQIAALNRTDINVHILTA